MDYLMIMNMYMSNRQNYCSTNFVLLCLGLSGDRLPHGGNQATGQPNNRAHGHMDGHMDGHRSQVNREATADGAETTRKFRQ